MNVKQAKEFVATKDADSIRREYNRLKAAQSRMGYTAFVASVRVTDILWRHLRKAETV